MEIRWIIRKLEQFGVYDACASMRGSRWIVEWNYGRKSTPPMRDELAAWEECLKNVSQ